MISASKKPLLFGGTIISLAFITIGFSFLRTVPSKSVTDFVKACGELNYKTRDALDIKQIAKTCSRFCGNDCKNNKYCIAQYLKNEIHGIMFYEKEAGKFIVVDNNLDQGWRCKIDLEDNSIEGIPYYNYPI